MRKVQVAAITLVLGLGSLYLVSTGSAKPLAPSLKVAVLVSDSGELGFAGPIQRAAVRMAVKDLIDDKSPVKLETSFIDAGDSASEHQAAISRVRAFDSDVVIAPIETKAAKALVRSIENNSMPIIAPSALEDDLDSNSSKPWIFRLATSPSQDSYALGDFIENTKAKSVLIVSSSIEQSRSQMKSLAFGLTMSGVKVQTANIKDVKAIAKTKPEALVLLSMEESIQFFGSLEDWVSEVPQVYLVPSNLADYSGYPWASALKGAQAISPKYSGDPKFKAELAKTLGNQAILGPRGASIVALAQQSYDAVKIAAEARIKAKNDSPEELRLAISKAQNGANRLFNRFGFYDRAEYSVFRYGSSGTFSMSATFSQN